jgi:glycosyltransferase involved in cell wall biosynthesis
MKVLVYLHSYPPHRYTGGELMTAFLIEQLAKRGHTITLYVGDVEAEYERHGIIVRNAQYLRADIAQAHDVYITHPEIRTAVLSYVGKRVPYVGIVHNTNVGTLRSLERQAPNLTIANSRWTLEHMPESVHTQGVMVVRPPVVTQPIDGPHDMVTIVNLSHDKGGRALTYIAEQCPDIDFLGVVGGHGVQVTNQPSNVSIEGPTGVMGAIWGRTKTLIAPTKHESYGMAVAEALAGGIPVIVSDIPAMHEVCGDAAMYVKSSDYMGWVAALTTMQTPYVHDEQSAKARERGNFLRAQTEDDVDRFEHALCRLAAQ